MGWFGGSCTGTLIAAMSLLLALAGCSSGPRPASTSTFFTTPARCLSASADREAKLDCLFEVDDPTEGLVGLGLQEKLHTGMKNKQAPCHRCNLLRYTLHSA